MMQLSNVNISAPPHRGIDASSKTSAIRDREVAAGAVVNRAAAWAFAAVLLLLAYEWLVSGLDKWISGDFRSGLAAQVSDAAGTTPHHWYARFLTGVVIPHASLFGLAIECGEIAVGLGLVAVAFRWAGANRIGARLASRLDLIGIGALAGSALMTANFYLMSGDPWPWVSAGNPFNEGVGIDCLLTCVAIALVAVHVMMLRDDRRRAAEES